MTIQSTAGIYKQTVPTHTRTLASVHPQHPVSRYLARVTHIAGVHHLTDVTRARERQLEEVEPIAYIEACLDEEKI